LVKKLDTLQEEHDEEMGDLVDVVNDLKIKEDELEVIRKADDTKSKKIDELCKQLLQKEQSHKEAVKSKESQHKSQIDAVGFKLEEAKSQISYLKDQMAGVKVENDLNGEKLKMEYEVKLNTLQGELDKKAILADKIKKLQEDVANKDEELEFIKEELQNKTEELEEVSADLDIKEASFNNESQEIEEKHKEEIEELIQKNESINAEIGSLKEKLVCQKAEFDTQMDIIIKDKKEQVNNLKDKLSEEERNSMDLEAKIKDLEESVHNLKTTMEGESAMANQKLEKINSENEELRRTKYELQSAVNNITTEKDHIIHINEDISIRFEESERQVHQFRSQFESLQAEYKKQEMILVEKHDKALLDLGTIDDMQKAMDAERVRVDELQVALGDAESERDNLRKTCAGLESVNKELVRAKEVNASLTAEVSDLTKKNEFLFEEIAREKVRLESKLTILAEQLEEKSQENNVLGFQVTQLESENNMILEYKRNNMILEQEKRELENQLVQVTAEARMRVAKSPSPAGTIDSNLNEDEANLKSQIDFLNSVIVDMQRKNDELKNKLELYESAGILDDTEFIFNGVSSRQVAPRVFCDICDEFDVHDTEDCPTQAMIQPEMANHTKHGAKRGVEREYCETCEIFGHRTEDCNEEETF